MSVRRDHRRNALLSLARWIGRDGDAAPAPPATERHDEAPSLAELLRRRGAGAVRPAHADAADAELRAEIDAVRERLRDFAATVERLRAARRAG